MKYLALTLFVIATLAWSCQKDVPGTDPGNQPASPKKLISKYTYSEEHTSLTDSFSYDQQNRCTRINLTYTDDRWTGPPYLFVTTFHYNGNDLLPYKITDTSDGRDMNWYLLYDGQKRKIKDSIVYLAQGSKAITNYSYIGTKVVGSSTYTDPTGNITTDTDTWEFDTANCIIRSYTNPGIPMDYQAKNTYDNHPNPFRDLNITAAMSRGVTHSGDFTQLGKNNPLTVEYSSPNNAYLNYRYAYTYTYDADGYPLTSTMINPANPSKPDREKFEYKK